MDIITYERGADWFDTICSTLPDQSTDYFDFPSSLIAFGESLGKTSQLARVGPSFWRLRNNQMALITYWCSGMKLQRIINALKAAGYKLKALNFVNKDFTGVQTKRYDNEHFVDVSWTVDKALELLSSKARKRLRQAQRHGEAIYELDPNPTQAEVMDVFEAWIVDAKTRHFMVCRGHYQRYIERFYLCPNNVHLIGFRRRSDGLLYGIAGYETHNHAAQVTLAKHRDGDWHFARYMWIVMIQSMLATGATKAFCGTTADDLKLSLGMTPVKSWKIVC